MTIYVDSLADRAAAALTRPPNFGTSDPDAFTTHGAVFSVHRDSDALQRSNMHVFVRTMEDADPDGNDHYVMGCRHWAVGWIDHLMVRIRDASGNYTDAFTMACSLLDAMDDYLVLDAMHYSELEDMDNHPDADDLCYSDSSDCGCGRGRAAR